MNRLPQSLKGLSLADASCIALCVAYAAMAFSVALLRYQSLGSNMYDLGMFDQALWNAAHRHGFFSPLLGKSLLQHHWMPILILLVPPYLIGLGGPWWLLLIQSTAVGASGFVLYKIIAGRRFFASPWPGVAIAAAYLITPGTQNALVYDFHPSTFLPLLELLILYGALRRSNALIWGAALLALMVKEHVGLSLAGLGLLCLCLGRDTRRTGLMLLAAGLVSFMVINGLGKALGFAQDTLGRYGWLGGNVFQMALTMLINPVRVLGHIINDNGAGHYLLTLFLPVLGLALLAPKWILPALPMLLLNLLADFDLGRTLKFHYQIEIMPWIFLAASAGLANVLHWTRFIPVHNYLAPALVLVILAASAFCAKKDGRMIPFCDGFPHNQISKDHRRMARKMLDTLARRVDAQSSVTASGSIDFPLVTHRVKYAMVPVLQDFAGFDFVIFDRGREHWDPAQERQADEQFERIRTDPHFMLDKKISHRIYIFRKAP